MLLTLLAIFSIVDAGGQIFSDGEQMTHVYTQESVHDAEDFANVLHMAESPSQIRVNIPETKIRLEPELMNLPPQTIIYEIAHEANLDADTANVIRFPTPLSHQHDISSEAIRLSDVINHIETDRQIGEPVDVNDDYQFSKQFINVMLRDRPTIAHGEDVHAEKPKPNIYVLSQPINVNYIGNSADAEVKLEKEHMSDTSGHLSLSVKSQSTKKPLHKKTTKSPTQKPVQKKTTTRRAQKPVHKKTTKRPAPAQKHVHKEIIKRPAQKPVHVKNIKMSVSDSTSIKVAKPVNLKVKLENKSKVKINNRVHVHEDESRITPSHESAHNKKHARRPVKKPHSNPSKGKDPLNIRIDEHTNIELVPPKSHIRGILSHSTDVDKPVMPVNVNVNVKIAPRRRPHLHPHWEPVRPIFSERHTSTRRTTTRRTRHTATRRTTTRRTTRRRVTPKPTIRKPATVGTVKLRYDVWLKFGGCEYMVKRNAKDFDNAEASCRRHGAHLVSIHSEAENNFIHKITSTGSSVTSFLHFVYIGLRKNSKNEWKWTDGSPMDYTKWAAHQPDWPKEETCAQLHQDPAKLYDVQEYHWNSIRCIRPMEYYVCKKCKHSHRPAPSHHGHKCGCCCLHCPCTDTCRHECEEPHEHTPEPRPTRPSKPPGEQAVFPKGGGTMCRGHNYMDDTMRMHMQDTHNFRRSELALGRIKDHKGKKMPTAANMNLLVWDCTLEEAAYNHVRKCPRGPSGSSGENFYRRTITASEPTYRDMNKKTVTEWWKVGRYQGGQNSFTMMGWAKSRRMGCVIATCGKDWVQSCRYDPPGNRGNQQYIPGAICSKCGGLQCNRKLGLCHSDPYSHK